MAKREKNLPEIKSISEDSSPEPPVIATGRFKLEQPPPSKITIGELNLQPTNFEDLIETFEKPKLQHFEGELNIGCKLGTV